jgi:cobyrinic acid a,c-diamide synthase
MVGTRVKRECTGLVILTAETQRIGGDHPQQIMVDVIPTGISMNSATQTFGLLDHHTCRAKDCLP